MDTARTGDVPAYGKNRPLLRAFGVEDRFLLADPIAAQPVPVAEQALDDAAAQSEGGRDVALATTPVQTIPRLVQQLRYLTVAGGVWSDSARATHVPLPCACPDHLGPGNDVRGFTT